MSNPENSVEREEDERLEKLRLQVNDLRIRSDALVTKWQTLSERLRDEIRDKAVSSGQEVIHFRRAS
jgi:chaperonin cofactor prefoldin